MRFPLPSGLLIASFVLAASTVPVDSIDISDGLTPENFESTIAKGIWFIEHFSPYCSHCRAFKPTWQQLVDENAAESNPVVHLERVDCSAYGDLCTKNGVTGYPQMQLYRDGQFVEKFTGAREYDRLVEFLGKYSEPQEVEEEEPQEEKISEVKFVEQARQVPERKYNTKGMVLPLTPVNFKSVLDNGPAFIKFFAPWCGHCKKLAPIWTQIAANMQDKLTIAEVDCDAHSALCRSQGVDGYPVLNFYTGGSGPDGHKTEYTGGRKFEQILKFAEMAIAPTVRETSLEDYQVAVKEYPVVYLFLHSGTQHSALNHLKAVSHVLLGTVPILTSTSSELRSRFALPPQYEGLPVLLAIKDKVAHDYTAVTPVAPTTPTEILTSWLLANRLPTSLELTQDTFQEVMKAKHMPLVVVVAVAPEKKALLGEQIKKAGLEWRQRTKSPWFGEKYDKTKRDLVFSWMDADRWASWLKSMYGIKSDDLPAIVIADHQNLLYYDTDTNGGKITMDNLHSVIEAIFAKKISYKYSENIFERMARHVNGGIMGLEHFVTGHPYQAVFFFVGSLGIFALILRKCINDDIAQYSDPKPKLRAD